MAVALVIGNFAMKMPAAAVYLGLLLSAPTDANPNGVEVSGNGYARTKITVPTGTIGTPVAPTALGWGKIVAYAIYATATGGTPLATVNLYNPATMAPTPINVTNGLTTYLPATAAGGTFP